MSVVGVGYACLGVKKVVLTADIKLLQVLIIDTRYGVVDMAILQVARKCKNAIGAIRGFKIDVAVSLFPYAAIILKSFAGKG